MGIAFSPHRRILFVSSKEHLCACFAIDCHWCHCNGIGLVFSCGQCAIGGSIEGGDRGVHRWIQGRFALCDESFQHLCDFSFFHDTTIVSRTASSILNCIEIVPGVVRLQDDPDVECWGGEHILYVLLAALPSHMLYSIGIPLTGFALLRRRACQDKLHSEASSDGTESALFFFIVAIDLNGTIGNSSSLHARWL